MISVYIQLPSSALGICRAREIFTTREIHRCCWLGFWRVTQGAWETSERSEGALLEGYVGLGRYSGLGRFTGVCLLGFFLGLHSVPGKRERADRASSALGTCRAREIFRAREIHRCLLARVW